MNSHKHGLELLWRTDAHCIWAVIRSLFRGPVDFIIVATGILFVSTYLSTTVEKVEELHLGIEALIGTLVLWPMGYKVTNFLIKRVTWYQEQTALSAIALQRHIPFFYVTVPLMLICAVGATGVLRMMPAQISLWLSVPIAIAMLATGIAHALYARKKWAPSKRTRNHPQPNGTGSRILVRSVMRFQLFGVQPTPANIAAILASCFSITCIIMVTVGNRHGSIAASAFICLLVFIIARPSYNLSRCASQAGYKGRTLAKAHLVMPLMIQAAGITAALLIVDKPSEFIFLALIAFMLAYVPTMVRALRYANAEKHKVEIRLFIEMLLVAMLSTPFPWTAIPGIAFIIISTVIRYRRHRWSIS